MANKYFYQDGTSITLEDKHKFASGGEGSVYMHPSSKDKCVKIYHTPKKGDVADLYKDLIALDGKYFIKPERLLFSQKNHLLGFEMKYVDTSNFFILKKLTTKNFSLQNGYDKSFKFSVYKNLKAAVESAHKCGVVIGDLNPYNILVDNRGNILFVDVDSYATKNKKHSGVLLEDIRDWLFHPAIDEKTDAFAFNVLIFWMFTYLHPFRGNTSKYKDLEERVAKKASVLSNIPDLVTPAVYEPFINKDIIKQFSEVFDGGRRFLVDMVNAGVIPTDMGAPVPTNLSSKDLYIRLILEKVIGVNANEDILVATLNDEHKVFDVSNYGVYNQKDAFVADAVFLGNKNYMKRVGNTYYVNNTPIKNIEYNSKIRETNMNGTLFMLNTQDDFAYKVAVDNVLGSSVQADRMVVFSPSISQHDSIVAFIGDNYWLFIPNGINHNLVKTNLNIVNAYYRGCVFCIEYLENKQTKYGLFKIFGTSIEKVKDLTDFSYFDVKNNFIFVPNNGSIDLISTINGSLAMTIDCPVSTVESKIFHTKAGMFLYEGDKIYFINRKN